MLKAYALPGLFSAPTFLKAKRTAKSGQPDKFWFFGSLALVIIIGAILLNYLLGVNNYTSRGYEIQKAQVRLSQLAEENKKMNLKVAEVSSVMKIQVELANSNFVPSGTMRFLEVNQYTQR